jgi:hypothetical protein
VPQRGEWQTLPPLSKPVLPVLPKRTRAEGVWSPRTKRMWSAWRADWVTGSYGSAEIAMAVELAYVYEDAVRESKPTRWAEVRQWMDRLGLTMKGKRDLRLRLAEAATTPAESSSSPGSFEGLRLVDDAVGS